MDGQWSDPFDHGSPEVDSIWRGRLSRNRTARTSISQCQSIVPEWPQIERASRLAAADLPEDAEVQRKLAGYHG
jgi:hypothetical protein